MGYGHPRSSNLPGRRAQKVLEDFADKTAKYFGGSHVTFHYDSDAANGLSILSAGRLAREAGREHIIASPVERASVVTALKTLRSEGSTVSILKIDGNGKVIPESLTELYTNRTGLVTCIWVNGISGVVQPVPELSRMVHSTDTWFHSDACDAAGRIEIDLSDTGINLITICSLKLGGPAGAAATIMSNIDPWVISAARKFSSMTNIAGVAGMVAALDVMGTGIEPRSRIVNKLRQEFLDGIDACDVNYSVVGGSLPHLLPGTALLNIDRVPEKLHLKLELENVILPSHNSSDRLSYLERIGLDISNPDQYLGFSIDAVNTSVDIKHFVRSFLNVISDGWR